MLKSAIIYESRKLFVKQLYFILLFLVVSVFLVTKFSNGGVVDYKVELNEWSTNVDYLQGQIKDLSETQKKQFDDTNEIIKKKMLILADTSDDEIEKTYNKNQAAESTMGMFEVFMIVIAGLLAFSLYGSEQKGKGIYQGLVLPIKRKWIFLAKIVVAFEAMMILGLFCLVSILGSGYILYGNSSYFDFATAHSEIPFVCYCLIRLILVVIQSMILFLFVSVIIIFLKKNVVSFFASIVVILVFWGCGQIGSIMSYSWINYIPTISLNFVDLLLQKGCTIDEVDFLSNAGRSMVDVRFPVPIVVAYDCMIVAGLFLAGNDEFCNRDY